MMKQILLCFISTVLLSCAQNSESNFSVMCEDQLKEIHISFNFDDKEVTYLDIPKSHYSNFLSKTAPELRNANQENTRKRPITKYTDSYIKYGITYDWDDERKVIIESTFNRVNMKLTHKTGYYKKDGSLAESPFGEIVANPTRLDYACEKPIT